MQPRSAFRPIRQGIGKTLLRDFFPPVTFWFHSMPFATPAVPSGPFSDLIRSSDDFARRHHGGASDPAPLLSALQQPTLDALTDAAVPASIRLPAPLSLPPALGESAALAELKSIASLNQMFRSYLGQGYYDTHTPAGHPAQHSGKSRLVHRLYALSGGDLPGSYGGSAEFPNAGDRTHRPGNRQRLDARRSHRGRRGHDPRARLRQVRRKTFFVSDRCHPQTIDVVVTRAQPLGIEVVIGD
jgi:glycine dehydrogenase